MAVAVYIAPSAGNIIFENVTTTGISLYGETTGDIVIERFYANELEKTITFNNCTINGSIGEYVEYLS